MRMRLTEIVACAGLLCVALLAIGVQGHTHAEAPARVTYIEPVHDFSMRELNLPIREEPISAEDHYGEHQPYADFLQISFKGFGKTWKYNLLVDKSMWEKGAQLKFYHGDNGEEPHTVITPKHRHYVFASNCTRVDAYFYNFNNMHALITHEGEIYTIDTLEHLSKLADQWILPKTEMGIYKHSHIVHGAADTIVDTYRRRLAQTKLTTVTSEDKFKPPGTTPPTRRDNSIAQATTNVWTNCYAGQSTTAPKAMKIGWAVTNGYYSRVGGTPQALETDIAKIISSSNHIYVPQMQVYLTVQDSVVYTTAGGESWNRANSNTQPGCPGMPEATNHLEEFRLWKERNHQSDAGVWHMMTDCFPPPGTVGIAYVGVLCNARAGAGWSSWGTGPSEVWKTVAHEIGHNFNADHSFENGQGRTGGIMDYGDGLNPPNTGVYEFNTIFRKTQVCAHIAESQSLANRNNLANCWGNARLTDGTGGGKTYQWADGTPLACPVTCQTQGQPAPTRVVPKVCYEYTGAVKGTAVTQTLCPPPKPLDTMEACNPAPPICTGPPTPPPALGNSDRQSMFQSVKYTKIYVFQGTNYAAYTNQNTQLMAAAEPAYPRDVAEWWGREGGLETGWKEGNFDAIIQKSEGSIYFFKGKKFVVYELGFGLHNEYKAAVAGAGGGKDMHTFFNAPLGTKIQIPVAWQSIDAAVSITEGAYIFKGQEYALIRWDCETAADCPRKDGDGTNTFPRPISDWGGDTATGGMPWPATWAGNVVDSSVGYWDETGADLYVSGQYVKVKWDQRGIASVPAASQNYFSAVTGTPVQTDRCDATFCAVCATGSTTLCETCEGGKNSPDYILINSKCQPKNFAVELLFEDYLTDSKYIQSANGLAPQNAWAIAEGNTGNGLALLPTQWVTISPPLVLGGNTPLEMVAYEFHFWIKPTIIGSMKMVTMELINDNKLLNVEFFLESVTDYMLVTFKTTYQDQEVGQVVSTLSHYEKIYTNRWYHLICTLQNSNMKITENGKVVRVPLSMYSADAFKKFTIQSAIIGGGAQGGGITGNIDQFHVDDLSKSGTTTQVDGNCIDAATVETSDGFNTCDFVARGNTNLCAQAKVKKGCCLACKGLYDATFIDGGATALQGTFWLTLGFTLVSTLFGWY